MAPVVAEIAVENQNTFVVAKLNIKNARETLRKYPIRATPTYMVFKNGQRVGKILTRFQPKAQLLQEVLNAINN